MSNTSRSWANPCSQALYCGQPVTPSVTYLPANADPKPRLSTAHSKPSLAATKSFVGDPRGKECSFTRRNIRGNRHVAAGGSAHIAYWKP